MKQPLADLGCLIDSNSKIMIFGGTTKAEDEYKDSDKIYLDGEEVGTLIQPCFIVAAAVVNRNFAFAKIGFR